MEYLTVREFANKTKMCAYTIRRAIRAGNIYAMRPGIGVKSPYRIPETELERLQICGKRFFRKEL